MILRNVVMSAERERLRPQRPPEPAAAPPPPERQKAAAPDPEPRPAPAPVLTAEMVCDWLQQQSPEVRVMCAQLLASDIGTVLERAREAGLDAGRAQGRQEALEGAKSGLAALAQWVAAGEQTFSRECAQLAESCADVVAEVFRKLAGPALVSREAALGAVLEVLKRVKDERTLTIRVNSRDLPFLESHKAAIHETLGGRSWTLCADPRVALGGSLVESTLGTLDGRLEIQLQELWETLRAAKAAHPEQP